MTELDLIRQKELEYCKEHLLYFVEKYVKIEDKDAPGIIVPFTLWDKQKDLLLELDKNRLNIILKARQLGITWIALAYSVWKMIQSPGYSIIALSRTEDEAKELVRRVGVILKYMPSLVRGDDLEGWTGLTYKTSVLSVEVDNGDLTSTFRAFTSSPSAGRSFTANLIILDEWAFQQWAKEIWTAVYPTVNRPNGGKVIGLSTMERGTLFEDIFTGDFGFYKAFLPWNTDPRRTQEWYDQTKRAIGDKILQEYPASIEEALLIPGGAFFPEMNKDIHIVPYRKLEENYRRYVSIDYGLDMLAAIWYAVDSRGYAEVYREFAMSGLMVSKAAQAILRENNGDNIYQYFAPPDLWNRNRDSGKSTAAVFQEMGIHLTQTSNERDQGWLSVKEWLCPIEVINEQTGETKLTARLTIQENQAPNLWNCLTKIQKSKEKVNDVKDNSEKDHDLTHFPDSLRAFAAGRVAPHMAYIATKKSKQFTFEKADEGKDLALWS